MFKTYLKLTWRNWIRDRQFTLLNLAGLSTGIACALLICFWVRDERGIGRFDGNDDRRFEVMHNGPSASGVETGEPTPGLLAWSLKEQLPEIAYAVPVIPTNLYEKEGIISFQGKYLRGERILAGSDFFHVLPYPLIQGNADRVLSTKYGVVISSQMSRKLFHGLDAVGKTISWNQAGYSGDYTVTGIFERPAQAREEPFDIIFNYALFMDRVPKKVADWTNSDASTFLLLKKGVDPLRFNEKVNALVLSRNAGTKDRFFLQRYHDGYLYNRYENGHPAGGRIDYLHLFSIVGVFILLIACINFINLSTAKASRRIREVGVKKVMGARRPLLAAQFLGDALMMSFASMLIALLLVMVLLPSFNSITGKQIALRMSPGLVLLSLGIALITGLLAGSYPAAYLSGFRPSSALSGIRPASWRAFFIRRGLVVFQFMLSAVFIVAVLVIHQQVQLIETKNLGYNRSHVIWFDKGGLVNDSSSYYKDGGGFSLELESFLRQLKEIPGVINAANFRQDITDRHGGTTDISWEGKGPGTEINFTDLSVGYDFIETMGIKLAAGRSFSGSYGTEKSAVIFNEMAIQSMGLKDPIGKWVRIWGEQKQIVGVVHDFHFESLHEKIKPCFFDFHFDHWASRIMVSIAPGAERQTIQRIQRFYAENNHGLAPDYRFLDADYALRYASEQRAASLSRYFAGIAIMISCLGLFGLAAFTAQQKKKEIGIRKVAGASSMQILILLCREFVRLISLALLIALPLAWWLTSRWLHDFAYRADPGPAVFLAVAAGMLLISFLTTGFQSIRAASVNPVDSLRSR